MTPERIAELVKKSLAGDRFAQDELMNYCIAVITPTVIYYIRDFGDAEDVIQDATLQTYRRLATYKVDRPIEPWFNQVARHICWHWLKQRELLSAREEYIIEVMCPSDDRDELNVDELVLLDCCLNRLPPDKQLLAKLIYTDHLTNAQIAEALEIKEATAATQRSRLNDQVEGMMIEELENMGIMEQRHG